MKIFVIDAFTSVPFKGNPAAVTIVQEFPSDERCLNISSEMNLSETAFVKPLGKNHFHIRWFTPTVEVKLCGHATLATSHILFEQGLANPTNPIQFDSLSGSLSVLKTGEGITLDFPLQKTGAPFDISQITPYLNVPVVNAVKAYDDVIIELENEQAVRLLKINPPDLFAIDCRGVIVTAKGQDQYDFVSRFFAPRVGIDEDPVTGSTHCKLAYYWMKKLQIKTFKVYQASKRGGELLLNIEGNRVKITGQALTILTGEMHI